MLIGFVRHLLQRLNRRCISVLLLVLFCAACSTAKLRPQSADLDHIIQPPAMVVLLPVGSISVEMRDGIDTVQLAAQNILSDLGYDVFVVKPRTYKILRDNALANSGSIYSPTVGEFVPLDDEVYAQAMLAQIQQQAQVQLLLMIDLELRDVSNDGHELIWDDARAQLEVVNTKSIAYAQPSSMKGLSFKIKAYDGQGRKRFVNRTGFALPYRLRVSEQLAEYQLRENLFSDLDSVQQTMRQALKPFSPSPVPPPGAVAAR